MASIVLVEITVALAAILIAILYFQKRKNTKKDFLGPQLPPGPPTLPLIGNLHQFGRAPQAQLLKWAEEYGPIYRVKMGNMETIVISDHKIMKEVFQEESASGRSPNPIFLALGQGNHGILMSEGDHWDAQRSFTLRKLREFGFSKTCMEELIMEEVNSMIGWFEKRLEKSISGDRIFNGAVVNSLWRIISGERHEWDAPEKPEMIKATENIMRAANYASYSGLMIAPFLRFIAPSYFGWTDWVNSIGNLTALAKKSADRHQKELDPNNPQDFLDHYLIEKSNATDPKSSFYKETGDKNLSALIPDLFLAGSETTAHTCSWVLLFVAKYQFVQRTLHEELDRIVGQSRQPSLSDRPNLPYTEAVLMEVMRRTSLAINGVPHRMLHDDVFHGYLFPENCTIIGNTYAAHHNPEIWENPDDFIPERFLSDDGTKVVKPDAWVPFSLGKRQCLGEALARDTLFLMITGILQKFQINLDRKDKGAEMAFRNIKPTTKMLNDPDPFKIILRYRENLK